MLITGARNIAGKELSQVLEAAGGKRAYALLRVSTGGILAISDSAEELATYKAQITCAIPAEDVREALYRRKIKGDSNHDKKRSARKSNKGNGTAGGSKKRVR